jgi:predicted FMN-binding regulatory protein PaiB
MYTPSSFRAQDAERIFAFVDRYGFGALVSPAASGVQVSHLPFVLDRRDGGETLLRGHLARANPHAEVLDGSGVAIFTGPHCYVTPRWYATSPAVPTWNYFMADLLDLPGGTGSPSTRGSSQRSRKASPRQMLASCIPTPLSHAS